MKKGVGMCLLLVVLGTTLPLSAQEPDYRLAWKTDGPLLLGGLALWGGAKGFGHHGTPLDPTTLHRQDVFFWERWVVDCHNRTATRISDATLCLSLLGGAVLALASGQGEERLTDLCVWSESMLLTAGLTFYVKEWVRRPRPSAYRKAEAGEPLTPEASRSFFSGHTSLAFASAVSALSIYSHRHGDSRTAWAAGLGTAAVCGLCRVWGGHHFSSDVLVGAAVGAFVGWAVPRLHESGGRAAKAPPGSMVSVRFHF